MGLFGAIVGGIVGFFVGGPVGAVIGAGLGATKVGETIVNKVLDFVTKPFMGSFDTPDPGNTAAREEGVIITKRGGGTVAMPVVYGFRQVGGTIVFAETGSDKNKYLWVAYALCEGPVEGVYAIEIDDNDISTPALIGALNRGETYDVNSGKYSGRVRMQFWYGKNFGINASGSPIGSHSILKEAPSWKSTNAYNGLCTLFVRYEWKQATTQEEADNNPFSGSIPSIKVSLLGRRILPIDGTSQTTDYITDVNAGRERYSTNPAECILDYLRNPWYGKGLSNDEIDWSSFQTARDKYNTDVTYVNGVKGPILTCNTVVDTDRTLFDNIKTLLQGCRSYMPYIQGQYTLKVEDAGNPTDITSGSATVVHTYTPDNIVGDISYGGIPRGSKYTCYEVTYVDPNNKWATNTAVYPETEAERMSYEATDGGRENKGSATFPTITNYAMAYDMARLLFFKSRYQESLNVRVTSQAMELEPGDNIQVEGNVMTLTVGPDAIPWRVISIKLNDDYSFDLGCVRNPDWIYPHTRANERDVILPPYIPKYESIIYPVQGVDLSLYPPSYAYTGGIASDPNLNPPGSTDPTGSTGGGVGDQNGTQNTNPVNVPPVASPTPVNTLADYIQIDRVDYVVVGNLVNATIMFKQPDNPAYAGVDFWFKRNISTETVYRTAQSTTIPGANKYVTHTFTNLVKTAVPYLLVCRVRYSDGKMATFTTTVALNVSGAISTENPVDYEATIGAGWSLPTGAIANPRDTIFASLTAVASLSGSSDRLLAITLLQDINNPSGLNAEVNGVNIYYKLASATYWKKHNETFDGSYFPGQSYTFTPALDLGVGTPTPDDASDNFDFIFRFVYKDGTESTLQRRQMGVDIQPLLGGDPFAAYQVLKGGQEPIGEYTFLTEEQAPPGSVVDPRDMTIGLLDAVVLQNPNRLTITIEPPAIADRPNWYGIRLRYRKVPPGGGVAPAFDAVDYFPVPQPNAGIWQFKITPLDFAPEEYQYIVTPVVKYSGAKVEAKSSWIGQGKLDPSYAFNFIPKLNFKTIESAQIPEITAEPFSTANPKVLVKSWKKIVKSNASPTVNNHYYELEYNADHIVGLTGVRIYRRSNTGTNGDGVTYAKHYGLGRWEYIDVVPGTNATVLANGNILVNLRMPISATEFNTYYGLPAYATTPLENANYAWATKKIIATEYVDFVIVASTSVGESEYGMFLPKIIGSTIGSLTTTTLPSEVPVASYNNYTAGYKRNIAVGTDGSRARVVDANIWTSTSTASTYAYVAPTPNRGSAVL